MTHKIRPQSRSPKPRRLYWVTLSEVARYKIRVRAVDREEAERIAPDEFLTLAFAERAEASCGEGFLHVVEVRQ